MASAETTRSRGKAHVALFDATTLLAKGVKDQLVARSFPTASIRLFTSDDDQETNLTEFAGEAMLVTAPDIDTLENLDIAFLCGGPEQGRRYLDWPAKAGFTAIDMTSASAERGATPVVNAAVNPDALGSAPSLVATPHPAAQFLSSVLAPVRRAAGLESVAAVVFQPASGAGDAGIEELHQQAISLLNFGDLPTARFGRQLAFNMIPAWAYPGGEAPGNARPERLGEEVRGILGLPPRVPVAAETLLVPVFHCHAAMILASLPQDGSRESVLAAYEGNEDVRLAGRGEGVTQVERAGQEGILVGAVREAGPRRVWIWAVADDLVAGTALNAVRIAETLLARGLRRGHA